MPSSSANTPRARQLGAELRKARLAKGLSSRALGELVGRHSSHVIRWEKGALVPDEVDLGKVCAHLGIDEATNLLELARQASDPNWLAAGVGRQVALVREYENDAETITNYQPGLVPGPLQLREYAEEVVRDDGVADEQVPHQLDFRMARAEFILNSGVEYRAIIGEYALRYPACSAPTAIKQLRHLAKLATLPHITIQVLPIGLRATLARKGPFVLIESSQSTAVVHLEQPCSSATLTDTRYVSGYKDAAKQLRRDAMSSDKSVELIVQIADEMERTT